MSHPRHRVPARASALALALTLAAIVAFGGCYLDTWIGGMRVDAGRIDAHDARLVPPDGARDAGFDARD